MEDVWRGRICASTVWATTSGSSWAAVFTGIVEELGSVQAIGGHRLRIHAGDLLDDAEWVTPSR